MSSARHLYRNLLKTVRKFPKEDILKLSEQSVSFPQAASIQIRNEFKAQKAADSIVGAVALAEAKKELSALESLLENKFLQKYPGPKASERLKPKSD